jgi:hypothetical protein
MQESLVQKIIDFLNYFSVLGIDTLTKPLDANDKSETQNSFIASDKPAENKSPAGNYIVIFIFQMWKNL